jgi:hypothetical protein
VVRVLVDNGADVHAGVEDALYQASKNGHLVSSGASGKRGRVQEGGGRAGAAVRYLIVSRALCRWCFHPAAHPCASPLRLTPAPPRMQAAVRLLLSCGADAKRCTDAVARARERGHDQIVEVLKEAQRTGIFSSVVRGIKKLVRKSSSKKA